VILGPWADDPKKIKVGDPPRLKSGTRQAAMETVLYRPYKLSPHLSAITPMFYSMARFCMLFANVYYYSGRSDSLGIIKLPAKKVCLVNSLLSLISCRNPDPSSGFRQRSLSK
jgi:hypothetical protein